MWTAPVRRRTPDTMPSPGTNGAVTDCHILVVEDDARLRERLARYLAGEGFRVTAAGDAADARAKLRVIDPDLMVLDVMMPGESGLDLVQCFRQDQAPQE